MMMQIEECKELQDDNNLPYPKCCARFCLDVNGFLVNVNVNKS